MDKTLQTMVGATDTVFFAAVIVVSVVMKMVCITQNMLSIPETTVCGTKTLFSEAEPIFCASETGFSITEKTVGEAPTVFV